MKEVFIQSFRKLKFKLEQRFTPDRFKQPVIDCFSSGNKLSKRALLVYRTLPFYLEASHPVLKFHQNIRQSKIIAEVLDKLGFSVDVVDIEDDRFTPTIDYDLIISHRSTEPKLEELSQLTKKVYLATGTETKIHNERQRQRVKAFEGRRGKHDIELVWDEEQMPWPDKADAIFCFGNEKIAETWRSRFTCPVFPFQNTALPELEPLIRNWDSARKHFLFLGSRQQLAKGLDILLETFSRLPDLHLHVFGHFRRDKRFCQVYGKELWHTDNIHSYGWIDVTGYKFRSIARKCAFTISATCAEGSPGSITNAMKLGLIPILPDEAGIDNGRGVLPCHDLLSNDFPSILSAYASLDECELRKLSSQGVARSNSELSEEAFRSRWLEMISVITKLPPPPSLKSAANFEINSDSKTILPQY